jgi:predicted  nucleic acid-binding Zn-ribbon protein
VDEKASRDLQKERAGIVPSVTPIVYKRYERARAARRGIGIAEVVAGRCSVCNIALRPQYFQELRRADQVLACETCQRILIYTPPESFEDLAGGAQAPTAP